MRWAETGFKLASLVNFIIFLHSGKYRCVAIFLVLYGLREATSTYVMTVRLTSILNEDRRALTLQSMLRQACMQIRKYKDNHILAYFCILIRSRYH